MSHTSREKLVRHLILSNRRLSAAKDRRTRRRHFYYAALGPGLLRDFCLESQVDYVGRNSQRNVVCFCRVSSPSRLRILVSHGVAPLKLSGGCYDQIPRTIIPRTSPHCRCFRAAARHQRPQVRVCVAWRHRAPCGLLREPGLLRHPFSLLQALRDHGSSNNIGITDKASHGPATRRKGLSSDDVSLILVYVR